MACAGMSNAIFNSTGFKNCYQWSPDSGVWTKSHTLLATRTSQVSWSTESGVYLIGGYNPLANTRYTSEKVLRNGSVVEGFSLKYLTEYKEYSIRNIIMCCLTVFPAPSLTQTRGRLSSQVEHILRQKLLSTTRKDGRDICHR